MPLTFDEVTQKAIRALDEDMETMALHMLLNGMYPSAGWRIAVHWESEGRDSIRYRLEAVAPGEDSDLTIRFGDS